MKSQRRLCILIISLFTLVSVSFAAAAQLDTPSLTLVKTGRTSVTVDIAVAGSGAPAGFELEWLPASTYNQLGGWPDASDTRITRGNFIGVPTLNTTDGTDSYQLVSLDQAGVEVGDLFDETGLVLAQRDELLEGTAYVVRTRSLATASAAASNYSGTMFVQTQARGLQDCTYTQGYWKNHTSAWPVTSLVLGTVTYTSAQLKNIFNQPAVGNGLISLSHQLIAAKLNIAQGASVPVIVLNAITSADAMIGGLVIPSIGTGSLAPASTSNLTSTLDDYNNGVSGPGHCSTVPTRTPTWGHVKSLYR